MEAGANVIENQLLKMIPGSNASKSAGGAAENSSMHSSMLGSKVAGGATQLAPSVKSESPANLGQLSVKSSDISGGPLSAVGAPRAQSAEKVTTQTMPQSALAPKPYG